MYELTFHDKGEKVATCLWRFLAPEFNLYSETVRRERKHEWARSRRLASISPSVVSTMTLPVVAGLKKRHQRPSVFQGDGTPTSVRYRLLMVKG